MSRTIRRKTLKNTYCTKYRYHSDMYETINNSPSWYRRMLNSLLRKKQKAQLKNTKDYDNLLVKKLVKDCAWYW